MVVVVVLICLLGSSETIGPMWVFLAYDRYDNNEGSSNQFGLNYNYVDRKQMFFSSFNYAVEKRGHI